MAGLVLAFSGGLGSGKSLLTNELSRRLGWPRVSFGTQVRRVAEEFGRDSRDRTTLQQIGQMLVLTKPIDFIRDVLNQVPNGIDDNIIVEGVRHVEILIELKRFVLPRLLKLIHINADVETRQRRFVDREKVERRLAARYDSDITEAQVSRILPQYADLTIDGSLPIGLLVEQVIVFANNWTSEQEAKRA